MNFLPPDTLDVFIGTKGANQHQGDERQMYGRGGDDLLMSDYAPADYEPQYGARLYGGAGRDGLIGSLSNDLIDGGRGADVLMGGAGDDYLRGGKGRDVFDFSAPLLGTLGIDTIADFNQAKDKLRADGGILSYDPVSGTLYLDPDGAKPTVAVAKMQPNLDIDL